MLSHRTSHARAVVDRTTCEKTACDVSTQWRTDWPSPPGSFVMDDVYRAWATWEKERTQEAQQVLLERAAVACAQFRACPTEHDAPAVWAWAMRVVRAWLDYEGRIDPRKEDVREARAQHADVVRATLGILRNASLSDAYACQALAHTDTLAQLCAMCVAYERMSEPALLVMIRVLTQLLVNLVTRHEAVRDTLWTLLAVPPNEAGVAGETILRLLSSADDRTSLAAHVFLLNSAAPHTCHSLVHTAHGRRVLQVVLASYDAALVHEASDTLHVILALSSRLCAHGHWGPLLQALGPTEDMNASQLALVRTLIDNMHMNEEGVLASMIACLEPLVGMVTDLSRATTQCLATIQADPAQVPRLVRAHVGLLALLEAVHVMALHAQETPSNESARILADMRSSDMIHACIELLREARAFVPPRPPFQPAAPAVQADAHERPSQLHTPQPDDDRPGLPYLKRTALQVLGTLAFHAKGTSWDDVHAFQDRVREAGGLIEVLSLTQLDELNPYIREHAIFALRNLLDRNPTSQDHVAQLRPHT